MLYKGVLITLEGPEKSGKTTQIQKLERYLKKEGFPVVATFEPGGTLEGDMIRRVLFSPEIDDYRWTPTAELFMFEAARAMNWANLIKPALVAGKVVASDRFSDSTTVYQGAKGGLPWEIIEELNLLATEGNVPDLTLYFDIEPEMALQRGVRVGDWNRIDARSLDFHRQVRDLYLKMAREEGGRWRIIDARPEPEIVFEAVKGEVEALLASRGIEKLSPRSKER